MSDHEADLVAQLKKLGYRVTPPRPKDPMPVCSVCGAYVTYNSEYYDTSNVAEDAPHTDYLMQVVVQTNLGEEGYDKVVKFFCDEHDYDANIALMEIGYKSHHHGGTALLQDPDCPGYGLCPVNPAKRSPYEMDDYGLYKDV